jgi:hypothetical protein
LNRLRALRAKAGPLDEKQQAVVAQVLGPEICNWALFETIARVCSIIGRGEPDVRGTGHLATVTPERWRKVWAYYLACRHWLAKAVRPETGYQSLLELCDPRGEVQRHVEELLGPRDALKELYVERFCVCLDAWLDDLPPQGRPRRTGLEAATAALEQQILAAESEPRVPFKMIRLDDHSVLQICHHKLFRRYDVILSSIGDGQWRKSMPRRGTDGFERAKELNPYLTALEHWLTEPAARPSDPPAADLVARLGEVNAVKRFQVALMVSLLRAQQESARCLAQKRVEKTAG